MKNKLFFTVLMMTIFSLFLSGRVLAVKPEKLNRKIVVFKPEVSDENVKDSLIEKHGGQKIKNLRLI